jgi:hypothetical protein
MTTHSISKDEVIVLSHEAHTIIVIFNGEVDIQPFLSLEDENDEDSDWVISGNFDGKIHINDENANVDEYGTVRVEGLDVEIKFFTQIVSYTLSHHH